MKLIKNYKRENLINYKKNKINLFLNTPSRILGSIESAAASVLGAGDETLPATRTAGKPIELPSLNNIETQVGEGLGQKYYERIYRFR